MRFAVYVCLVAFTVLAVAQGHLAVAAMFAATKASLVGIEYMELRSAHRAHAVGFVVWAFAMATLIVVLA